jgi:hypothetical protein
MGFLDRRKLIGVSIVLFVSAIILLSYCHFSTIVVFSQETPLGLADKLPAYYWVGLMFVLVSLFLLVGSSHEGSHYEKLFLLEIFVLALYLYAIPTFVEENVYFYDSWMHSGRSLSVLASPEYYSRQFPGAFIFQCVEILITGMNPVITMKFFPILFSALTVLISYILFRKLFVDRKMAYLATIFLVTGSVWVFPKHVSPNSFALILYFILSYYMFSRPLRENAVLMTFLIIAIVASHPITSIVLTLSLVLMLAGVALARRFSALKDYKSKERPSVSFIIVFLFVFLSAWFLFSANDILIDLTRTVVRFVVSFGDYLTFGRFVERFGSTSSLLLTGQMLKVFYSIIFVSLGVTASAYIIFRRSKKFRGEKARFFPSMASWIVACLIFGVVTGFFQAGEFYERALLYGFVPLSYLAVFVWEKNIGKIILVIVLLLGAPLAVLAAYSNEYFEYVPVIDLHGVEFMVHHNITDTSRVKVGFPTYSCFRFYVFYKDYQNQNNLMEQPSSKNEFLVWSRVSYAFYSVFLKSANFSTLSKLTVYEFWLDERSNITSLPNIDLVYSSSDFILWMDVKQPLY